MPEIDSVNVVKTRSEAIALLDRVWRANKAGRPASVDTEFGRDEKVNREYVTVWSVSTDRDDLNCLYADPTLDVFKDWLVDEKAPKVYHTYTADADSMADSGYATAGLHADIWVMSAIVDSADHRHDLKYLEKKYGIRKHIRPGFKETFSYVPVGKKKPILYTWDEIFSSKDLRRILYKYSAWDAEGTIRLYYKFKSLMQADGWDYFKTYLDVDRVFTLTLHNVMKRGFLVNKPKLVSLEKEFRVRLMRRLRVFREMVDEPDINPNSHPQLNKLFFNKLDYPGLRQTKTGFSTDTETLEKWAEAGLDIAQRLLDYRELESIRKTFLTGVLNGLDEDGRLYSDLNQVGASATGRISSRKYERIIQVPHQKKDKKTGDVVTTLKLKKVKVGANLQNIPARSEEGKRIREIFIAEPGRKLIIADLAGAEWWMMGHFSKDEEILDQFHNKKDPHSVSAVFLFELNNTWQEVKALAKSGDPLYYKYRYDAKCFHPDTEVLTHMGWKRIIDLEKGEEVVEAVPLDNHTVSLNWVKPLEVFTKHHPAKKLVHLKNEGVDIRVTPDHRMLIWGNTGKHAVVMPDEFSKARTWCNAGQLSGGRQEDERLLKLAVATQADGSITYSRAIRFGFTKKRKIVRLKSLLKSWEYKISKMKNGVTAFYIAPEYAQKITRLLDTYTPQRSVRGSFQKRFPWSWLSLSEHHRNLVLEETCHWDGNQPKKCRMHIYMSTVKHNVDVIQAIASITNRKTRMVGPDSSNIWRLSIRTENHNYTRGGAVALSTSKFTDKVACLSVPSSFVLVRDKGVPLIVGQTANFGLIYLAAATRAAQLLGLKDKYKRYRRADGKRVRKLVETAIEQGQVFIDRFYQLYKGIRRYQEETILFARRFGYVTTISGRRLVCPEIHSDDEGMRAYVERAMVNGRIQGSIADIIKKGMNEMEFNPFMQKRDARILLQIHDEVIWTVPEEHAEDVRAYTEKFLPQPYSDLMEIKLSAEAKIADSWAEK